ncbi:MAG: hypothetical protein MUC88_14525 [Planctomycetes bacterium]|jgi:hypothetical protein|nr:hypothetical protein [Planctomycetota bacterium]
MTDAHRTARFDGVHELARQPLQLLAERLETGLGAVLTVHSWRQQKPHATDTEMENTFLAVVDAVDRLTT